MKQCREGQSLAPPPVVMFMFSKHHMSFHVSASAKHSLTCDCFSKTSLVITEFPKKPDISTSVEGWSRTCLYLFAYLFSLTLVYRSLGELVLLAEIESWGHCLMIFHSHPSSLSHQTQEQQTEERESPFSYIWEFPAYNSIVQINNNIGELDGSALGTHIVEGWNWQLKVVL